MRNRLTCSVLLLAVVLLPSLAFAQQRGPAGGGRGRGAAPVSTAPFDAKDYNGIWWRTGGTREWNTVKGGEPEFTAAGKAKRPDMTSGLLNILF